jgi:hypothetical protein
MGWSEQGASHRMIIDTLALALRNQALAQRFPRIY